LKYPRRFSTIRTWLSAIGAPAFRMILGSSILGALLAVAASKILPAEFVAESTILIEEANDPLGGGLSRLADLVPMGALSAAMSRENGYTWMEILRSRSVLEKVLTSKVEGANGTRIYDLCAPSRGSQSEKQETAVERLRKSIALDYSTRDHILHVAARHERAEVAAQVANLLVDALREYNLTARTTHAKETAQFITERVRESGIALASAERSLVAFQESNARIGNSPNLRLTQKRLERDVQFNEQIHSMLTQQLELANIDQKKDGTTFSVLDPAKLPARPDRMPAPLAAILGFLISGSAAVLLELLRQTPRVPEVHTREAA
jgi:uncharacterized protein involved in exopolysaccharide biosynthesis